MGNGSVIRPGNVQRMSAGTGVRHSEFNASKTEPVHFLQIWIMPEQKGIEPSYEEKNFAPTEKQGKLKLVGSRDGRDNSVTIHQDVDLYLASLKQSNSLTYTIKDNRVVWLQVAQGSILLNEQQLEAGDGAAVTNETEITITGNSQDSEILLFDLK